MRGRGDDRGDGTTGGDEGGRSKGDEGEFSKVRGVDYMSEYRECSEKEREFIKHQKKHMDSYYSLCPIRNASQEVEVVRTYINRCNIRFAS
jgi:hypothetical protein